MLRSRQNLPGGRVRLPFPIFFSRHGETDWNKARRFQGHSDIALNDTGRQQAANNGIKLRAHLNAEAPLHFVASPLSRATETLEIIKEQLGLPRRRYAIDDRLIEIDLGQWNGKTVDEINEQEPDIWQKREANKWDFVVPGGESYADAAARTREFLTTLTGPTVIVGHGASGRLLRGYLTKMKRDEIAHMKTPQDICYKLHRGGETII